MENCFQIIGTRLVIYLPAEVDHHNAESLKRRADQLLFDNCIHSIVFDFSRTSFMDSSGIGMIMGRYKNMQFMGGTVRAVRVNERMRKLLLMSGVGSVIDMEEGDL